QLLLEGRQTDLAKSLRGRMEQAAQDQEYERAARYRDMISTVSQLQEKQRIAAVEGDDMDVFGYHFENDMLAVNGFHMLGGKILDRREFFWEELPEIASSHEDRGAQAPSPAQSASGDGGSSLSVSSAAVGGCAPNPSFSPGDFFSALMKQIYIDQQYVPRD